MKKQEIEKMKEEILSIKNKRDVLQREKDSLFKDYMVLKEKYEAQSKKFGGVSRALAEKTEKLKAISDSRASLLMQLDDKNKAYYALNKDVATLCEKLGALDLDYKRVCSKLSATEFHIILFKSLRWYKRIWWALKPGKFFDAVLDENKK